MEQESQDLRANRCVQCAKGHRICSRTKPCALCIGARRASECVYPDELRRDANDPRKRQGEQSGDVMKFRRNLYAQKLARPSNSYHQGLATRPNGSSSVAALARTQIYRQQEKVSKKFSNGFIYPRLRIMNSHQRPLEMQTPAKNMNTSKTQSPIDPRLLVDAERIRRGNTMQAKANGTASTGSGCKFPLFENQMRYTLDKASTTNRCMEFRNTGRFCNLPYTFPCEEKHIFPCEENHTSPFEEIHSFPREVNHLKYQSHPHAVCHDCRRTPDMYDVKAEDEMIAKNRIYFCQKCTDLRATGPEIQVWEHPRRPAEIVNRKDNKCACHDELQRITWLCGRHRVQKAQNIKRWGQENLKSFKDYFGGDFCACCRTAKPEVDGPTVMWQCAYCQDIIVQRQKLEVNGAAADAVSDASSSDDDTLS